MIPSPPSLLEKKDIKKENEKKTNSSILNGWTYSLHKLDGSFDSFLKSLTSIVLKEETSSETRKKITLNQQILSKTILNGGETIEPPYSLDIGTSYFDYLILKQPSSQDMVYQIDEHYKMLQKYSNYSKLKKNDDAGNERMRQKCLVNILGSLLNFNQVYKKNEYDDLCKFHTVIHPKVDKLNLLNITMDFLFKIMGIDVLVNKHCIPVLEDNHFSFYVLNKRDMTIQAHSYLCDENIDSYIPLDTLDYITKLSKQLNEKKQTKYKPHCFHLKDVNEETIQFMKVLNISRVSINIIDELQYNVNNDLEVKKKKILNDNNIEYNFILYSNFILLVEDTNVVFHPSSSFGFSDTYKMYEPRLETDISILTYNLGRSTISENNKGRNIKGCFSDEMVELKSNPPDFIPTNINVNKKVCFRNMIRIAIERSTDIVCLQEIREEDLIKEVSSSFSPFHISESHVLADRKNGLMTLYRQHLYYLDQTKGGGIFKGEMMISVPSVPDMNTSQKLKDTFPYLILYLREKKDEKRSICIINIQFPNLKDYKKNYKTNHRNVVKHMIETKLNEIVPYQSDIVFLSGDFGYGLTMEGGEYLSFKSKDDKETFLKYGSYQGSNPSTCCTNTGNINELKYKNDTIFANVKDSKLLRLDFYPRDDSTLDSLPNFAFSSTHLPVRAYIPKKEERGMGK